MYEAVKTNINKSYAYTCTDYDPLDYCKKGELYDVYIKDGLAYISPCHSVCVMDEEMFMKHFEPFYKSPANPFHPEKKNHADKH